MAGGAATPAPPSSGAPVLVLTKLHPPRPRRGHVPRARLADALATAGEHRVTLVRAPAGAGKTTLLAQWLAEEPGAAVAWVALDAGDNDRVRFWTYVLEALRSVGVAVSTEHAAALAAPGARAADVLVPHVVNAVAADAREVTLVLDDFHVVEDASVHEAVAFLLERLPASAHVVLATRTEPSPVLGLARLRARGELGELSADDLRFGPEEAARLVETASGHDIDVATVEELHRRTEGWAAGLYLGALRLRRSSGRDGLPAEAIDGASAHVADYLTAEMLDGQPPDVRAFLLRTSILARLCGSLCDEVLQARGSADRLEAIERSNLLLVPLDDRRLWFRYHHLLGDLLRARLEREAPEDELRALHRRAAGWWERHGEIGEAVGHAIAGDDDRQAADLVARNWNGYLQTGHIATVRGWLDALAPGVVAGRPDLLLARAWSALDAGDLEAAARAARDAASAPPAPGDAPDIGLPPDAGAAMLLATVDYMRGDLGAATAGARRGLELCPAGSPWVVPAAATLGSALLFTGGSAAEADAVLRRAIDRATPGENMIGALRCLGADGLLALEARDRDRAERDLGRALDVRDRHALGEYPWAALTSLLSGRLAEDAGDLASAATAFDRAASLARRGRVAPEHAFALARLARVHATSGDHDRSRAALREARAVLAACADPGVLGHAVSAAERRAGAARVPAVAAGDESLTEREIAVTRMLATSLSQREIAATLFVSPNTLKTHVRVIYRKLGADSREAAVARARERELL